MTKLLLDMDGVLVDFVGGACQLHGRAYPYEEPETRGDWDICRVMGIAPEEFWAPMNQAFWENLNPTSEAFPLVEACERFFGIESICLLTSPTLDPDSASGKINWIRRHLPRYSRRFLIGPPKQFCAHANAALIDDSDANCERFAEHGGVALKFPRHWNAAHRYAHDPLGALAHPLANIVAAKMATAGRLRTWADTVREAEQCTARLRDFFKDRLRKGAAA